MLRFTARLDYVLRRHCLKVPIQLLPCLALHLNAVGGQLLSSSALKGSF